MSIIHVNQIRSHIHKLFDGLVDSSDVANAPADQREDFFLTRGLAAYAISYLAGIAPAIAALSVVDGADDNGIDAIYYDEPTKKLYLVQSKWIKDGAGEPSNGDVKKFLSGVHDLFNTQFDRFNPKVRAKEPDVFLALNDPATKYEVVIAYTGTASLSEHSQRDLRDLRDEMNDTSEVVFATQLNQGGLHLSLVSAVAGEPIALEIGLKAWGKKDAPYEAYYGQVSGEAVAEWWAQYRMRLFSKNLRSMLPDSDVNDEMRLTLGNRPEDFWYFNNGITVLARRAQRAMAGGASHDFAVFHCEDISVVNGAQTVGSVGKFADTSSSLANVLIPIRIIVRGDNQGFGDEVTRSNNRQNRIENRDFVTLDPEQTRLRNELAVDRVDYQVMRSESVARSADSFDLVEATTALACSSGKVRLAVQLKREIGKLWEDLGKAPYRELFNPAVPGLHVWRCVQVQRRIDAALGSRYKRPRTPKARRSPVATHGNRIVALLVFDSLPVASFRDPGFDVDAATTDPIVEGLVDSRLEALVEEMDRQYPGSIIPTLFKNQKKCESIVAKISSK